MGNFLCEFKNFYKIRVILLITIINYNCNNKKNQKKNV